MNPAANPVFVALDTTDPDYAQQLAERVRPHVGGLKLGLEFFSAHGPDGDSEIVHGTTLPPVTKRWYSENV